MGLLDRLDGQKKLQPQNTQMQTEEPAIKTEPAEIKEDPFLDVKRRIHTAIIDEMNKSGKTITDRETMYKLVDDKVNDDEYMIPRIERVKVALDLFNDIMDTAPLKNLFRIRTTAK